MNLPELNGSEKQVKWANDLRNEVVVLIDLYKECLYDFLEYNLEKAKKTAARNEKEVSEVVLLKLKMIEERNLKLIEYLKEDLLHNQTESTFFIDFRFSLIDTLEWCATKKKEELKLNLDNGIERKLLYKLYDKVKDNKKGDGI